MAFSPFDFSPDDEEGSFSTDLLTDILAPVDPHGEEYAAVAEDTARRKQAAQKRDARELRSLESLAELQGLDIPKEPEQGFFMKFLDTVGTPGQWVHGGIANLAGLEGYKDLPFLDAVKKGADEDLYTGEMLRGVDLFNPEKSVLGRGGANFARGAVGAIGDVLTDPLSYITTGLFGGTARKVGGIPVNEKYRFPTGETIPEVWSRTQASNYAKEIEALRQRPGFGEAALADKELLGKAAASADRETSKLFQSLRGLATHPDQLAEEVVANKNSVFQSLGFSPEEAASINIKDLYQKQAIRGTGPLAGSPLFGRIPVFGDREFDIPGLTPLSEKLYDALKNARYGIATKLPALVKGKAAEGSGFYQMADAIGSQLTRANEKTSKVLTSLLSPVSLRIKTSGSVTGSSAAKDLLTEELRAKGALGYNALEEARFVGRNVGKHFKTPEEGSAALDEAMRRYLSGDFNTGLAALRQEFNQRTPGMGDDVADLFANINGDFEGRIKNLETKGLLDGVIQNVGHGLFNEVEGMNTPSTALSKRQAITDSFYDKLTSHTYRGIPSELSEAGVLPNTVGTRKANFGFPQLIKALSQDVEGFTPDRNILGHYAKFLYAEKRALAEKDFTERLAFNFGLKNPAYDRIKQLAEAKSDAERIEALRASTDPASFPVRRFADGTPVSPEAYDRIVDILHRPNDPAFGAALKQARSGKFQLHINERSQIVNTYDDYVRSQAGRLGKEGEMAFTPAGGTQIENEFLKPWERTLTGDDQAFWANNIPQGLADSVQESHEQFSLLTQHLKKLEKEGKDPATSALAHVLGAYQGFHKWMKAGATVFWPGYWSGNILGSQIQALEQASFLGQQFNIGNILRTGNVLRGADFVMKDGRVMSNAQAFANMRANNITPKGSSVPDLMSSMGDMLHAGGTEPDELLAPASKGLKTLGEGVPGTTDRLWKTLPNFGARLEAFGREHLFLNLLEQGFDPMSAGQEVNRLLIDYTHGKTKFEQQFLNNLFFFYSFSRGQATNNFMAMMRKPGVLSTQLALHKEIAETMTDPSTYEKTPDVEEAIRTARYQNALTTYVGNNPRTGLPQVLSGTRLPIEDIAKFGTVSLPKSWNANEIIDAVGDTTSDTLRMAFSQTNPALRGVFEALTAKRNFFFDRPIDDPALNRIAKWEASTNTIMHYAGGQLPHQVYETLDEGMKKFLGGKDNGDGTMSINPYAMTVLTYFVPFASRFLSTRKALTQPGVEPNIKYQRFLSGSRVEDVDPEKTLLYDRLDRVRRELRSHGKAESKSEYRRRRAFDLLDDDEDVTIDEE